MCVLLSVVDALGEGHGVVVVLLVVVHPHLGRAPRVAGEHVARAAREAVGMLLAEHVPHARARHDLQAAPALPHPETDLCGGRRSRVKVPCIIMLHLSSHHKQSPL